MFVKASVLYFPNYTSTAVLHYVTTTQQSMATCSVPNLAIMRRKTIKSNGA